MFYNDTIENGEVLLSN